MVYPTKIEWHDLRIAPDDIPDVREEVLVTVELLDGSRRVQANVFLKEMTNNHYCWCTLEPDFQNGKMEDVLVWYEVVAWAYYPKAHII